MDTHPADSTSGPAPSDGLRLDHIYRETHRWEESVAWWENLGFSFESTWGESPHRAGSLRRGSARVVLAEVGAASQPAATTFLSADDVADIATRTGTPIVDTHWGTRMVTLEDPDGRISHFEPQEDS